MKMEEVRSIARSYGINPSRLSKNELIRSIQVREGNFDCFATAYDGECDQAGCSWRKDCFEAVQQGALS